MYLGIDIGTSGVKAVLVDDAQCVVGEASAPLQVRRPQPRWSEQDPEDWWRATNATVQGLREERPEAFATLRGVGLSGQMHGAVLLDAGDRVLRPAILWNDGRAGAECAVLERRVPSLHAVTGNRAMPGFTAPKLLWVAAHEPEVFAATRRVLLPKDYVRLRLTGDYASDMSDAAGTLWLNVGGRRWASEVLAATHLCEAAMPRLVEGSEPSGALRPEVASAWGVGRGVVVAGGAGDNAAGAVGAGVIDPGDAFLSLGTSGVYFVAGDRFAPNPQEGVHAFCHCLPGRWHQMAVLLSAASCMTWLATVTGAGSEAALFAEIERSDQGATIVFLPYLSGERTPHNDPFASGLFVGLTHASTRADLGRAVLEGVAFAFADGQDALLRAGTSIGRVTVIGGGARARFWGRILASALGRTLVYCPGGALGPAFGAARLARLAVTGEAAAAVCVSPPVEEAVAPEDALCDRYERLRPIFRRLYRDVRDGMHALSGTDHSR